jgi:hypothetical protein
LIFGIVRAPRFSPQCNRAYGATETSRNRINPATRRSRLPLADAIKVFACLAREYFPVIDWIGPNAIDA